MLCLASCFTVETQSGLSAPLTENRTENQKLGTRTRTHTRTHTLIEIKRFGPASVVITDGSNLFPLCGLEHQMVNVAGVAFHHLGNSVEKQYVNKNSKHVINKLLNECFLANLGLLHWLQLCFLCVRLHFLYH